MGKTDFIQSYYNRGEMPEQNKSELNFTDTRG